MKALVSITLVLPGIVLLGGCSKIEEPSPGPRLSATSPWPPTVPSPSPFATLPSGPPSSPTSPSGADAFGIYRVGGKVTEPVEISRVSPVIPECQVAPEFPPQFAPESPPSRCDVRTGPMGSSPVSSLFSASLQ